MGERNETLLFLVDVQVRNAKALRELDAQLDAAAASHVRRLQAFNEVMSLRPSTMGPSEGGASVGQAPVVRGDDGTRPVGIRGRQSPGSRMNPIVTTDESGAASGLGAMSQDAAIATDLNNGTGNTPNVAAAVPAPQAPQTGPQQNEWLSQAAERVAQKVVQPEDDRVLDALESVSAANRRVGANPIADVQGAVQRQQGFQQLADVLASREASMPRSFDSGEAAGRLGRTRSQVREMAATGVLPGSYKRDGQWVIPEDAIDHVLAGGGTGGGGRPPIRTGGGGWGDGYAGGGGDRGGHGSRFQWNPFSGARSNSDRDTDGPFSWANIWKGDGGRGGAFGLPGFGSVGSLAGLGLEHWMLTGMGLGVSAGSALGGATLLGAAGLTTSAVGGGADALINHDTIKQAKDLYTNVQALDKAIAVYGAGSKQAAAAQYNLNQQWAELGGGAGKQAIVALDNNAEALQHLFDVESGAARIQSADLYEQILGLATTYTPLVTGAADRNLTIINTSLRPLFTWLKGPEGVGIFDTLEDKFASDLPTSIHALDMGIEDFLRLMQAASQYTGGLADDLDNFFTDKNRESTAQYDAEVQKLVGDLREWEQLLGVLDQDMGGVFKMDAGTANSIVGSLTAMLERLHDWEQSTQAQGQLQTVFAVHKQQILALLNVLPSLLSGYGSFYLHTAPPLVEALSHIAEGFSDVADAIEKVPGGSYLLGLMIVLSKLGMLSPALKATAAAIGLMTDAEAKNAPAAAADAVANRGLDTSLSAGGVAGVGRGGEEIMEGAEGAGAAGMLSRIPKVGGVFDRVASSGVGTRIAAGTETAALGAAGAAEGAGMAGLAEAVTGAGAAVAPLAAGLLPVLAAAGGVAGLIELFHLFSGSSSPGEKVAKGVADTLGISTSDTAGIASHQNAAQQAQHAATIAATPSRFFGPNVQASQQAAAEAVKQYREEGQSAAAAFVVGVQNVKFPSTLLVFEDMRDELSKLPAQARGSAAQTMLGYAQELQSEGKLPRDAVSTLIQDIEGQFPALRSYLKTQGLGMASDFATSMKMTEAISNTRSAITELQGEFGAKLFPSVKLTSDNLLGTVTNDFSQLRVVMGNETGAGRREAEQNMAQLKETALSDATALAGGFSQQMVRIAASAKSGSQQAVSATEKAWPGFASAIEGAEKAGVLSVQAGNRIITQELAQALQVLGVGAGTAQKLAKQGWTVSQVGSAMASAKSAGIGPGQPYAGGGLLQVGQAGQAGRDTVPLKVGGSDIVVGAGEQVAVFNRHQQPIVNRALAREGYAGLPGLFQSVRTPHFMATGGIVPGFAEGGTLSYGQLEGLWDQAGGPRNMAALMAAIAEAESGGNASAENPSGASGLWQILGVPFPGNPFNPLTNARMAVSKYESQGLGAWATYTSGAYRQFLHGNVPASAGDAGFAAAPTLTAPTVHGSGAIAEMTQAVLSQITQAANTYLAQAAPSTPELSGGAGVPVFPVAKGPVPAPVQVALEVARHLLGRPYISGGYGLDAAGLDCSGYVSTILNAAGLDPAGHLLTGGLKTWGLPGPGKWITVGVLGADSGPTGHTMIEIDGEYYESGGHTTAGPHQDTGWSSPFTWWRHPAGLAAGGLIGSADHQPTSLADLAQTSRGSDGTKLTPAQAQFLARQRRGSHRPAPKPTRSPGVKAASLLAGSDGDLIGKGGPFPFDTSDLQDINQMLQTVFAFDGGDSNGISAGSGGAASKWADLLSWNTGTNWTSSLYPTPNFSSWDSPSDFVIQGTDAAGNTTYTLSPNINTVAQQLAQAVGWQGSYTQDIASALGWSQKLPAKIQAAITRRQDEAKKIRARITANIAAIKALRRKIADAQAQIKTENGKAVPYKHPKNAAERTANARFAAMRDARISNLNSSILVWEQQIKPYEAENQQLGGSGDTVGTGGELATITSQLGTSSAASALTLAEGDASSASGLFGLLPTVDGWISQLGGVGGDYQQQNLQLKEYQAGLSALLPGAQSSLASDLASLTTSTSSSASTAAITGETGFSFQGQQYVASMLGMPGFNLGGLVASATGAYQALASLPAWGGSFMTGGVVPGAVGEPRLIEAHGGEIITNPNLPGASNAGSGALTQAVFSLTDALCSHERSVRANTAAMAQNTSAMSSSTTAGRVSYSRSQGAYDPMTSSDVITNLGVGN